MLREPIFHWTLAFDRDLVHRDLCYMQATTLQSYENRTKDVEAKFAPKTIYHAF